MSVESVRPLRASAQIYGGTTLFQVFKSALGKKVHTKITLYIVFSNLIASTFFVSHFSKILKNVPVLNLMCLTWCVYLC